MAESDLDLVVVDLPGPQGAPGAMIRDLQLPPEALITMITRGQHVIPPKGSTCLQGWDHVTVLAHGTDEEAVRQALLAPFEQISKEQTSGNQGVLGSA